MGPNGGVPDYSANATLAELTAQLGAYSQEQLAAAVRATRPDSGANQGVNLHRSGQLPANTHHAFTLLDVDFGHAPYCIAGVRPALCVAPVACCGCGAIEADPDSYFTSASQRERPPREACHRPADRSRRIWAAGCSPASMTPGKPDTTRSNAVRPWNV